MDRYVSAKIVTQILKDKALELEGIVRCYEFEPRIRHVSPLYQMFTHNKTEFIVSYDLIKMYIAIMFYLKTQLSDANTDDDEKSVQRVEYDLGYTQYHLMKLFDDKQITQIKYEEDICHAYEKGILKYLFLIQVKTAKQDEQLLGVKDAVLSMTDNTLCKLGFVHRLSNFKMMAQGPFEKDMIARLEYYQRPVVVGTISTEPASLIND